MTTSDNGNPWCPAGSTTPEAGKLVLSSCRSRIGDFLFNNGAIDFQAAGCQNFCNTDSITTVPTTTALDPTPRSRPWLESSGGQTNVANGVSMAAALACVLPQGINGCGFESQLKSAQLAVARSGDANEAQYGFVEPGRLLISDEADCSYNPQYESIFTQDGNRPGVDPDFENSFGIGPGCSGPGGSQAVPPARRWKVLQELGPAGQQAGYSICDPSFDGALGAIGSITASYF